MLASCTPNMHGVPKVGLGGPLCPHTNTPSLPHFLKKQTGGF